uniref:ACT domain-containing protein n=1 Tax=Aegilops tauschii subsp. strangulata TaxID=200361 RepID=A0A453AJ42_AEGTS
MCCTFSSCNFFVPPFLVNANEMLLYKLYGLQTSIVFSLEEGPGQLFKALAVFALRKINLTKMESRPHKKRPLRVADDNSTPLKHFDYLFYVDFEASMADPNAQNALSNLKQEFATFLRVLGSYPTDVTEA